MIKVEELGPILKPTNNLFENKAVLNPAVYQESDLTHIFYRAIAEDNDKSSIGYAKLKGPIEVIERLDKPIIDREAMYEMMGCEDPRVVKIEGTFYMTYTAHDGKNAVVALATSQDIKTWKKEGVISPQLTYDEVGDILREEHLKDQYAMFESFYEEFGGKDILLWEKDAVLFPEKINGRFALLHRVLPDIQVVYFDNFEQLKSRDFWVDYLSRLNEFVVLENRFWFETRHIGGGAPPIKTKGGWLFLLHSVEETNHGRVYRASAALLDLNNPQKVLGRLKEPLFGPNKEWDKVGGVSNVVFPTGTAIFGDDLYIYYGAADHLIAVAKTNLTELLNELKKNPDQQS
ncbi:MAG: pesticidal protein Cry7Aa [bacterium]|nr:pesticidal protein Cry7Aa [bacterium]